MSTNQSRFELLLFSRPKLVIAYILIVLLSALFFVVSMKNLIEISPFLFGSKHMERIDVEVDISSHMYYWLFYYLTLAAICMINIIALVLGWKKKRGVLIMAGLCSFLCGILWIAFLRPR